MSFDLVVIDWNDLIQEESSPELLSALERAYGRKGAGIIGIRNVPGFVESKAQFLRHGHALATLDADYLEENLVDAESLYNAGWSHGKEKMGNTPDLAKGSFYYNPVTDSPGTKEERQLYKYSYIDNLWPDEAVLPGFRQHAVRLGIILTNSCVELSRHLDRYVVSQDKTYEPFLYKHLKGTEKAKARLLYYFPLQETSATAAAEDSWIGWHNDSGFLTALAGDIYVDHQTGKIVENPDPQAGLYISRQDKVHQVAIPHDCLMIQVGECTQIVSNSWILPTPHCVKGIKGSVARCSLACFVDVPPYVKLSSNNPDAVLSNHPTTSSRVPALAERWTNNMAFGDFLAKTFVQYYEWTQKLDA